MYQMNGFVATLGAIGQKMYSNSREVMDQVIQTLNDERSIFGLAVAANGKTIPLDAFLARVRPFTESDNYFMGTPLFDIWVTLPMGLQKHYDKLGLSAESAERILTRFNAYTWNEHCPELRTGYIGALQKTLYAADEGWCGPYHRKEIIKTIRSTLDSPEAHKLTSTHALSERANAWVTLQDEVDRIPGVRLIDYVTHKGRMKIKQWDQMVLDVKGRMKHCAQLTTDELTTFGDEYRKVHAQKYYPNLW